MTPQRYRSKSHRAWVTMMVPSFILVAFWTVQLTRGSTHDGVGAAGYFFYLVGLGFTIFGACLAACWACQVNHLSRFPSVWLAHLIASFAGSLAFVGMDSGDNWLSKFFYHSAAATFSAMAYWVLTKDSCRSGVEPADLPRVPWTEFPWPWLCLFSVPMCRGLHQALEIGEPLILAFLPR